MAVFGKLSLSDADVCYSQALMTLSEDDRVLATKYEAAGDFVLLLCSYEPRV